MSSPERLAEGPPPDETLWRDIPNHPGYQAHPEGFIRSWWRKGGDIRKFGLQRAPSPKLIWGTINPENGYRMIGLRGYYNTVHRILAETFLPNPEGKKTVNHKNGNRLDNRIENLEWSTWSEQHLHKCRVLESGRGETSGMAKLTESDVLEIVRFVDGGEYPRVVAERYGVSKGTIQKIISGETWQHVTGRVAKPRRIVNPPRFIVSDPRPDADGWVDVPDRPGYQANANGQVRSCWTRDRINGVSLTPVVGTRWKIVQGGGGGGWGYRTINFGRGGGTISRHRLIAQMFIPNPDGRPTVNHKNGVRGDDRAENLEWTTQHENAIHSTRVLRRGSSSILSEDDALDIFTLAAFGATGVALAQAFNISKSVISNILTGRAWNSATRLPYHVVA